MTRIATVLLTLGALATTACGGAAPDVVGGEGAQNAPLWMVERDLPGCDSHALMSADPLKLLFHPFDAELVIAVHNGSPVCIDTAINVQQLRKIGTWQPPVRKMTTTSMELPKDDPVPIRGEEEDGLGSEEEETDGSEQAHDGMNNLEIPDLDETISDDPVPIKGGKSLSPWAERVKGKPDTD